MQQWIRKFSLILGTGNDGLDVSQLRSTFTIKKTAVQTPNEAQIKIYNLSEETAQQIQKEFTRVILQAGYQENFAVIFDGTAKQIKQGLENGTDTYLEIMASDGDIAYNFAVVNTTLAAGSTTDDHIKTAGAAMSAHGVKTGHIAQTNSKRLARGKVMYGSAKDYLRQSAQSSDTDWSIQDGQLQVVPFRGLLPTQGVVLTSKSGLIGSAEQSTNGIRVKTLLNPMLKIGSKVIIDNKSIELAKISSKKCSNSGDKDVPADKPAKLSSDGSYKIIQIEYTGDTRGSDWFCDLVCIDVDETVKAAKNG